MSLESPRERSSPPSEAVQRLLESWRGEIEAGLVYELLAQRERDPRRADVLRRIAATEGTHRQRIEARLAELGVAIPDPASVRLSGWRRLQVRLAPADRILASQEAAEENEVKNRYRRPTGDATTDVLLKDIRRDESSHSRELVAMRAAGTNETDSPPQAALQKILGRERGHAQGTGWISGAIYGANDGLAAVFGIVTGVSGATGGSSFVLTAGLAGALASALSMATGAFLATRSEMEVAQANLARERQEVEEHPEEEKEELSLFFQLKGLAKADADEVVAKLASNPETLLSIIATEELGIGSEDAQNPIQSALAAGISTALGAIVPVLPFFWLQGTTAVLAAAVVSLVAHFLVGAAKSLVTLRTWWAAGLEMTLAGIVVGTVTYAAGLLFSGG